MNYLIRNYVILILAAGQSKRLGSPKQLLTYGGETLIGKVSRMALGLNMGPVCCVLGAHADTVRAALGDDHVHIVWNEAWMEGMAGSLRVGLQAMQNQFPETDGVLILVCDQPFLDQELIEKLVKAQRESGLPAAAASYQGKPGTPALFHKCLFPELLQLQGDKGARKLLERIRDRVCELNFEQGSVDIDTPDDYARLMEQEKRCDDH